MGTLHAFPTPAIDPVAADMAAHLLGITPADVGTAEMARFYDYCDSLAGEQAMWDDDELRDRCAIYLGRARDAVTDTEIGEFARLEGCGRAVRRG